MKPWMRTGVLAAAIVASSSGCSHYRKTVSIEESADSTRTAPAAPSQQTSTVKRETTLVRENPDESPGVLSTFVHFTGEVLALPFRLVGSLLRAIF